MDCINVFEIELKLAIKFSFLNGACANTTDGLVHKGFELVLNIIFQQPFSLRPHLEYSLSEIVCVQRHNNIHGSMNVCIHEAPVHVTSALLHASLGLLKRNLYVCCFVVNLFVVGLADLVVPMGDAGLLLLELLSRDCELREGNICQFADKAFQQTHFAWTVWQLVQFYQQNGPFHPNKDIIILQIPTVKH